MDVLIFNSVSESIKRAINKKCGLNLSQTRLLLFFDRHQNETLTMGELAQALSISLSTLSRQIKQKKTAALIQVERSKKDSTWSQEKIQDFDSKMQIVVNNLMADEL